MNGDELSMKAGEAREACNFLEALGLCDEAVIAYAKENNTEKFADVCASRALTLRHIADDTSNKNFLILAKYAAKAGVKIIKKSGSAKGLATPLYTLGKIYESMEKFDKAKEAIGDAVAAGDGDLPKVAVSEMQTRLDAINVRLGDSAALESFNADVKDLEEGEFEDEYIKNVWVSGAYMHMGEALLAKGDKDKAKVMIDKARTIIDSDARLTIRAKQLAQLDSQIN